MAIIDIKTQNEDISWVIRKNPQTQAAQNKPFEKKLRKGMLYAWYKSSQDFRLWFKEGKAQSSFYKELNNGYLDQSGYHCAYVYCAMVSEMLSATAKEPHEKDIICENSITLSSVFITLPGVAKSFIKYFENDIKIEMKEVSRRVFNITFSGYTTLYKITNLVQVFCLIQSIEDRNIYLDLSVPAIKKYAQSLKNIKAPYFIVYLFLSRCVADYDTFKDIKPMFETEGWILNYGNTQKQRFDAIKKFIKKGHTLQDMGCGELYYSRHLSHFYDTVYAWDADAQIQARNEKFIIKKGLKNIILKPEVSAEDLKMLPSQSDILITEMLEHMPFEVSKSFLQNLAQCDFRRLIITLPNHDFNKFYKLENAFRHDDHYWEPSFKETVDLMTNIFKDPFNVEIKPIGDGVDSTHVSTLIIVERVNV